MEISDSLKSFKNQRNFQRSRIKCLLSEVSVIPSAPRHNNISLCSHFWKITRLMRPYTSQSLKARCRCALHL